MKPYCLKSPGRLFATQTSCLQVDMFGKSNGKNLVMNEENANSPMNPVSHMLVMAGGGGSTFRQDVSRGQETRSNPSIRQALPGDQKICGVCLPGRDPLAEGRICGPDLF